MSLDFQQVPTPHPALGRLAGLCRRNSIEDYQKTLVNRIKRHFEKRRKQWERDIRKQEEHFNVENKDYINNDKRPFVRNESIESTDSAIALSDQMLDPNLGINLIDMQSARLPNAAEKLCFKVDISSFLPNGAVRVQPDYHSLVLIGEVTCADCKDRRKNSRNSQTQTVKRSLKFKGAIDPASMRVHTTPEGHLKIEVQTIPVEDKGETGEGHV